MEPNCYSSTTLNGYVAGNLNSRLKVGVDKHIVDCSDCMSNVIKLYNTTLQNNGAALRKRYNLANLRRNLHKEKKKRSEANACEEYAQNMSEVSDLVSSQGPDPVQECRDMVEKLQLELV